MLSTPPAHRPPSWPRRHWPWLALGTLLVSLAAGVGVAIAQFPRLVTARVESIAASYGVTVLASEIEADGSHLTLRRVLATRQSHPGMIAGVREVAVTISPWRVLTFQRGIALNVDVRGLTVDLDVSAPGMDEWLQGLRRPGSGGGTRAGTPVRLREADIRISDAYGLVFRVGGLAADRTSKEVQLAADFLSLGDAPRDAVMLTEPKATLVHGAAGWQLKAFSITSGRAQWSALPDTPAQGATRATFEPLPRRLAHTLARFRQRSAPADAGGLPSAPSALLASAMSWLTPDATLLIQDMRVWSNASGQPKALLQKLQAQLVGRGPDRFETLGSSESREGGQISWGLTLRPAANQIDGSLRLKQLSLALVAPFLPDLPWERPDQALVDARLDFANEQGSADAIHIEGEASLSNLALYSPRLAPEPITQIAITLAGSGRWHPKANQLDIHDARLQSGAASARLAGSVLWQPDAYRINLKGELPLTSCNAALQAIPLDMLAELSSANLAGNIAGSFALDVDAKNLDATQLSIDFNDGCVFVEVPAFADVARFKHPFQQSVLESDDTTFEFETGPGAEAWVPLRDISPFLVHAVLAHEDAAFFKHHGFSVDSIRRALIRNLKERRYAVGASTISMQLVKNVFLHREKTLARKVQEALLTWWVERAMPKNDILELYLNVIEYGPEIYGVRRAAETYFGRAPKDLSPAEAVYLANILPNPKKTFTQFAKNQLPPPWRDRLSKFLKHMAERGRIDAPALAYGTEELKSFAFHRDGTPAVPRTILGTAAPSFSEAQQ